MWLYQFELQLRSDRHRRSDSQFSWSFRSPIWFYQFSACLGSDRRITIHNKKTGGFTRIGYCSLFHWFNYYKCGTFIVSDTVFCNADFGACWLKLLRPPRFLHPTTWNANANRYWTKATQPIYPDLNMATDDGSKVKLGFIVEVNFLIQPELMKMVLEGVNTRSIYYVSMQIILFRHNSDCKRVFRRSKWDCNLNSFLSWPLVLQYKLGCR